MKIYSFDGKKSNIDNVDLSSSPLFLGQRFTLEKEEDADLYDKKDETQEKQIEN